MLSLIRLTLSSSTGPTRPAGSNLLTTNAWFHYAWMDLRAAGITGQDTNTLCQSDENLGKSVTWRTKHRWIRSKGAGFYDLLSNKLRLILSPLNLTREKAASCPK